MTNAQHKSWEVGNTMVHSSIPSTAVVVYNHLKHFRKCQSFIAISRLSYFGCAHVCEAVQVVQEILLSIVKFVDDVRAMSVVQPACSFRDVECRLIGTARDTRTNAGKAASTCSASTSLKLRRAMWLQHQSRRCGSGVANIHEPTYQIQESLARRLLPSRV